MPEGIVFDKKIQPIERSSLEEGLQISLERADYRWCLYYQGYDPGTLGKVPELSAGAKIRFKYQKIRQKSSGAFTFGTWNPYTEEIILYYPTPSWGSGFEKRDNTLRHELGHRWLDQRIGIKAFTISKTAEEATAKWVEMASGGDISLGSGDRIKNIRMAVKRKLGWYFSRFPERGALFSSIMEQDYPEWESQARDASILDYIYRKWGTDKLLQVIVLMPRVPEEGGIKGLVKRLLHKDDRSKAREIYEKFGKQIIDILGVSLLDLSDQVFRWYESNAEKPTDLEASKQPRLYRPLPRPTRASLVRRSIHVDPRPGRK